MIYLVLGLQNSGKTLFCVNECFKEQRKGKIIFSNIHLNFRHHYLNKNELLEFAQKEAPENSVFLLDEFCILFDSARALSKANLLISYFLIQTSKKDITIYITAQTIGQVFKRIRENAHFLVECQRVYIMDKKIYEIVTENRLIDTNNLYIKAKIMKRDFYNFKRYKIMFINVEKAINLYNTRERVFYSE